MSLHPSRRRQPIFPLICASAACIGLLLPGARAHAAESGGSAALTSDYVWRGSTQTQGDPAVQAGFKLAGTPGFYGSVWASNVEFAPETHASSEFDVTLGWARSFGDDWALDVNVLHYMYPSATGDLDWTELGGTVTWKGSYWVSLGVSSDALGQDRAGVYGLVGARLPVNGRLRFEAVLGHYDLGNPGGNPGSDRRDDSYTHGAVSAIWAFNVPDSKRTVEARITAHATDSKARAFFGDDYAGTRIEAALQAGF